MKLNKILALSFMAATIFACDKDENKVEEQETITGTFQLEFDNQVNRSSIDLKTPGDVEYDYVDINNQAFNLTNLGYYISKIELVGSNGVHADLMVASPNADEVKGYYQVLESDPSTQIINLSGIPEGSYNELRFTIGIDESGVQQGAMGGILDPAAGAWFWNWNAGYISMVIEGNADNSGQEYVDGGSGSATETGTFSFHIGGWKDVIPAEGETQKFVNNIKVITLDLESDILVTPDLTPNVHIAVDIMKILNGVDFSTTYAAHRPDLGAPFANNFQSAFSVDHVHQ